MIVVFLPVSISAKQRSLCDNKQDGPICIEIDADLSINSKGDQVDSPLSKHIAMQYIVLFKGIENLQNVLDAVKDEQSGKREQDRISFLFEQNMKMVLELVSIIDQKSKYMALLTEAERELEAWSELTQKTNICLKKLRQLSFLNILDEEYVRMIEGKVGIFNLPDNTDKEFLLDIDACHVVDKKYIESFKDKKYAFLIQGHFVFYRIKNLGGARELFHKAAELGSEEAKVMEVVCEQLEKGVSARDTMNNIEKTILTLMELAAQMTDPNSTADSEDEFIGLFNSYLFNISLLNRRVLTDEESVYALETWIPRSDQFLDQFMNDWIRIKTAKYYGSKKLEKAIMGKSVVLDVKPNITTLIRMSQTN